ncbi:HAD family hydrolase [Marivita sp. S0852]|uniref:HAD family hydrolase n=1 Tax=Marivita sp. S0852 TaxID=3373893 RepID=UPI0039827F93
MLSSAPPIALSTLFDDVDLVIFDFDGVVADSEVISLSTLQQALADFGIDMTPEAVRKRFLGTSMKTMLDYVGTLNPTRPVAEFPDHWQATLFQQFERHLVPVPGVVPLVDQLDAARIGYCIASSSSFTRLGVALDAMSLTARFSHVFSAEQVVRGKPAPDLFLYAAGQLDVAPSRCLVIEDSPFGVQAAKAADMRCAGFVGGQHMIGIRDAHAARLSAAGADLIVQSFAHVMPEDIARGQTRRQSGADTSEERPNR